VHAVNRMYADAPLQGKRLADDLHWWNLHP